MPHDTVPTGPPTEANMHQPVPAAGEYTYQAAQDPEGVSYDPSYGGNYGYNQFPSEGSYSGGAYAADYADLGGTGTGATDGGDGTGGAADAAMLAYAAANGDHAAAADSYGGASGAASAANAAEAAASYSWPADSETMLSMLQQQRQQYRSWVAQCASTALAALDPSYDNSSHQGGSSYTSSGGGAGPTAAGTLDGAIPDDVPGLVAAMDVAGSVRQYLLALKAAAESVRDAARAGANFDALSLPLAEDYGDPNDAAAGEAAEAEFVSAAYGVTSAVAAAQGYLNQLAEMASGPAAVLVQEVLQLPDTPPPPPPSAPGSGPGQEGHPGGRLQGPLAQKLERVGAGLCRRLRQEAEALMGLIQWPPPLADGGSGGASGAAAAARADGGDGAAAAAADGEESFRGFESHPIQARRLVGVLTALTHFQMAVEQRAAFYHLLSGQPGGGEAEQQPGGSVASFLSDATEPAAKPLLWAAQALAEPVAVRLRAHFHPAAPTGRLDRPAWLYSTALEFVRRHGHALSSLDNMLACLQLKPHYNMPAEFARAVQEAVLDLLRDLRIPAILELRNLTADAAGADQAADGAASTDAAAEAEAADALLLGFMDASAAYDVAMLPLLGATGARAEADAARALAMLSAASSAGGAVHQRRRACDQFDPTAVGTGDMHARYVAVAVAAPPAKPTHGSATAAAAAGPAVLKAWAAAEAAAALRTLEAVVYDESSLAPADEAVGRALGGLDDPDSPSALRAGGGGGGAPGPWQRETYPPLVAQEAVTLLGGLVARSRWLSADPLRQRDFLDSSAGPVLGLLRRRLGRLVDTAVARGEVVSEEGLPRVCAALCAAHFLDDHLHSLLITDLAPLVQALNDIAAAAAANAAAAASAAGDDASGPATPSASSVTNGGAGVPAGKLGAGGGFWSGLIAAAAGGGAGASPARMALRDGVTALAAGASGGAASLASAPAGGVGAGAGPTAPVLGEYVRGFARQHRDGCLKVARELALGFGRCSVAYRHAIEANPQFPFTPESDAEGDDVSEGGGGFYGLARPASSITPSFAPALMFLQTSLERLSRCCDKATFADIWRGAALSINRFMFNFIATESRFTRAGARQFAADVTGLAQLFMPYSRRGAAAASRPGSFSAAAGGSAASLAAALASGVGGTAASASAGGQHFRELQAAARLLCLGDEDAAEVMRRASAAAVAAQAAAVQPGASPAKASAAGRPPRPGSTASPGASFSHPPHPHARGDPVRSGMSADPLLSSAGLACLSPLQIMNVIEHRI